jgi:aminoglycoside 2'-N-acetyltransferase I
MPALHEAPSDGIPAALLREFRALLDAAFDDFTDDDWQHALGGVFVWVQEGSTPLAIGALVDRTIVCAGQSLRVGYVESVATAAAHRRRGYGTAIMQRVAEIVRERYPIALLSTGAHGFYERLGWERWQGDTFVDGPSGRVPTPDDDGGIMILRTTRVPLLDLHGDLVADWRSGDVW